jgi:cyclase
MRTRALMLGAAGALMAVAGVTGALREASTAQAQGATQGAATELFTLQKVADGVYAALAKPRSPINCNAAVVLLGDGVLVVDTHSRPSSARGLIGQIKALTDLPVTFAVNTHFHWDHAQGNKAYPVAFPKQVAIVASEATRENLKTLGGERLKDQLRNTPGTITTLEAALAKATDAATQARLRDEIAQQKDYLEELKSLELTLPDLTFDKSLIIHRGDRRVVLLFLGRGHTDGDVVAWLPKERVVATGDLLHGWMPYMGDSYPPEWVETLDALGKLEFDHIIGGHGGVKPRAHLTFFRNYLDDLVKTVRAAHGRGETLDQAKTSVAAALKPKYDAGMGGEFAGSIGANVEKVYGDVVAKKY